MTDAPLPSPAQRVQQFLLQHGSHRKVQLLPESTATAFEAANALCVPLEWIGKSIVFGSKLETVVVVLRGIDRVNLDELQRLTHIPALTKLKATEVKQRTGYVLGGVSPLALPANVSLIIDLTFNALAECYVAAGHPNAVVKITPDELIALTKARVSNVT